MKQFTLLFIDDNSKTVKMMIFLDYSKLLDYKKYCNEKIKNYDLKQVDKDGYVWFCESEEE